VSLDSGFQLHRDPLEPLDLHPNLFLLNPVGRIGVAEITLAFSNLGQNYDCATCCDPALPIESRSARRTIRANPHVLLTNPLPSVASIHFRGQFDSRYRVQTWLAAENRFPGLEPVERLFQTTFKDYGRCMRDTIFSLTSFILYLGAASHDDNPLPSIEVSCASSPVADQIDSQSLFASAHSQSLLATTAAVVSPSLVSATSANDCSLSEVLASFFLWLTAVRRFNQS
jgi:hypothetical protein